MRFSIKLVCLLVLALSVAACGRTNSYGSIEPGQETARSRANLELPPDLTQTASDRLAAQAAQAEQDNEAAEVLPETGGLNVERNDEEGWIEVDAPAEQVWRRLVAHWGALDVDLVVSNPAEGVMETDWVEPVRSNDEEPGITTDKLLNQFLGKLFDEATALDKYTLTLQRTDNNRTRIDVAHRGIRKIQTQKSTVATNAQWGWVEIEEDPDKIKRALSSIVYGLRNGAS